MYILKLIYFLTLALNSNELIMLSNTTAEGVTANLIFINKYLDIFFLFRNVIA